MKKLILLLVFGVWCLPLTAGWTPAQLRQAKPAAASASSLLLDSDLNYANSTAATSDGWVNSASAPDWGYTTSPAPLGSYGYTYSFSDPTGLRYARKTFTASDEIWVYFIFYTPTGGGNNYWINVLDGSDNIIARVRNIGDTSIRAMNGTSFTGSSYTTTTGTKYVCFRYKKSTGGNNGIASVYISDTTTLPGTPTDTTSTGTSTAQAAKIQIGGGGDNTVRTLYQRIKISATDLGTAFP